VERTPDSGLHLAQYAVHILEAKDIDTTAEESAKPSVLLCAEKHVHNQELNRAQCSFAIGPTLSRNCSVLVATRRQLPPIRRARSVSQNCTKLSLGTGPWNSSICMLESAAKQQGHAWTPSAQHMLELVTTAKGPTRVPGLCCCCCAA
jgi:hypothetical protein